MIGKSETRTKGRIVGGYSVTAVPVRTPSREGTLGSGADPDSAASVTSGCSEDMSNATSEISWVAMSTLPTRVRTGVEEEDPYPTRDLARLAGCLSPVLWLISAKQLYLRPHGVWPEVFLFFNRSFFFTTSLHSAKRYWYGTFVLAICLSAEESNGDTGEWIRMSFGW